MQTNKQPSNMERKHAFCSPVSSMAAALALFGAMSMAAPAQALVYTTTLGPEVSGATGSGTAKITVDELANTMRVEVSFSGLSGTTTVAHIHGPTTIPGTGTAGVMTRTPTFLGFPAGAQSGSFDSIYDLLNSSTYGTTFFNNQGSSVVAARSTLLASLNSGSAYLNVHSTTYPGGEVRGFLQVPAPLPILGAAAGMTWCRRLRRRVKAAV